MLPSPLVSVSFIFKHNPPNAVSKTYKSWRRGGSVQLADPSIDPVPFFFCPHVLFKEFLLKA